MKTSVEMLENTDLYQFTDEGNSCQILDPATPRHWYNYYGMKTGIVPRFPRPVMAGAISSAKKQICA